VKTEVEVAGDFLRHECAVNVAALLVLNILIDLCDGDRIPGRVHLVREDVAEWQAVRSYSPLVHVVHYVEFVLACMQEIDVQDDMRALP